MKEIEKQLLTEIQITKSGKLPKISELIGDKGNFKLKVGKNVILVKDTQGNVLRRKVIHHTGTDSKVQTSMQDETDIKNILKKYGRVGTLPIVKEPGLYGDFSAVPDFQEAQNIIIKAERQFSNLSAELRKRFDNDPSKFLEFCTNEENKDEMYELGLANKKVSKPQEVKIVNVSDIQKKEGEE